MTLEELQQTVLDMQEQQKALQAENDNYKKQNDENVKKISDLQNINQKLFLKVTSKKEDETKEDDMETFEPKTVSKEFYDKLDEETQKLLQELEEEFN